MRILYYVPIAHTPKELGCLAKPVMEMEKRVHGPQAEKNYGNEIYQYWVKVIRRLKEEKLNTSPKCKKMHIYIDGLTAQFYYCKACFEKTGQKHYMDEIEADKIQCSVCGRIVEAATKEPLLKLVEKLIEQKLGSYLVIEKLMKKGAKIHGTESQEWLLKEHNMHIKTAKGITSSEAEKAEILKRRDEFIAQRINQTLPHNEIGILFIGRAHQTDRKLQKFPDIKVIYL